MENRVLRRIYGPKRKGVPECWKREHNELNNLRASPTIRVANSIMRLAGYVAHMQ